MTDEIKAAAESVNQTTEQIQAGAKEAGEYLVESKGTGEEDKWKSINQKMDSLAEQAGKMEQTMAEILSNLTTKLSEPVAESGDVAGGETPVLVEVRENTEKPKPTRKERRRRKLF